MRCKCNSPSLVLLYRGLSVALAVFLFCQWLRFHPQVMTTGAAILLGVILILIGGVFVSYFRRRWVIIVMSLVTVLVPLFFILLIDILVYFPSEANPWWTWPLAIALQMSLPVVLVGALTKDQKV